MRNPHYNHRFWLRAVREYYVQQHAERLLVLAAMLRAHALVGLEERRHGH